MTPELQTRRDSEPPLKERLNRAVRHLAEHNWYDHHDLRRLLFDCRSYIEENEQFVKDINKFDELPRQAE